MSGTWPLCPRRGPFLRLSPRGRLSWRQPRRPCNRPRLRGLLPTRGCAVEVGVWPRSGGGACRWRRRWFAVAKGAPVSLPPSQPATPPRQPPPQRTSGPRSPPRSNAPTRRPLCPSPVAARPPPIATARVSTRPTPRPTGTCRKFQAAPPHRRRCVSRHGEGGGGKVHPVSARRCRPPAPSAPHASFLVASAAAMGWQASAPPAPSVSLLPLCTYKPPPLVSPVQPPAMCMGNIAITRAGRMGQRGGGGKGGSMARPPG